MYRQSEKIVKQQYLLHMSWWYGELRPTNGWYLLASLGHPCKFQRVSRLGTVGSVTAWHSSSGRQPNFVALNRGLHLYSPGRASRWALAHIFSFFCFGLMLSISPKVNVRNVYVFKHGQRHCMFARHVVSGSLISKTFLSSLYFHHLNICIPGKFLCFKVCSRWY